MKKILFIHQNFPAQFTHLAPALEALGNDVRSLTTESNSRPSSIRTLRYRFTPRAFPLPDWKIASHFAEQARRGEHVARAASQIKKAGYRPDIIVGHPGWGETLFLADIWPDARQLAYAEFFYRANGQDVGFDPEFSEGSERRALLVRSRQAAQLLALETAHQAISPTIWQASTYPDNIRQKTAVIHDGIDTDAIRPRADAWVKLMSGKLALRRGDEVLTFVSRNLEPYRGFHIFMRALPALLRKRPELQVVIVGGDEVSYGGPPAERGNWKQFMLAELAGRLDLSRIHFTGRIPHATFISLMQVSRVHAYLTYPFVLSWSLLEAMSAGVLVIGSATPPVAEVITHGNNGLLVDFFDVHTWTEAVIQALADPDAFADMRLRARQTITARYDLRRHCLPRQLDLLQRLSS